MKRLFSPRFQRVSITVFLLLVQLGIFILVFQLFLPYYAYFYWGSLFLSCCLSLWVASSNSARLPYKISWIILTLIFPLVGAALFFILGGGRRPDKRAQKHTRDLFHAQIKNMARPSDLRHFGVDVVQQSHYLLSACASPPCDGTETRYFPVGEDLFPVLLKQLRLAKRYIFLEYFIISEGKMWNQILSILKEKAAEGLDVRVMYDDLGSVVSVPTSLPEELRTFDIQCRVFGKMRPVLSIHQNNRDHRKICVVDGTVAFVGGPNIADEYINEIVRFGYWKDSSLMLRGKAAWSVAVTFLHMWESVTRQEVDYNAFQPEPLDDLPEQEGFVQPYWDTPLSTDTMCADLHLQMFSKAKWYLYITTPYLAIDESIASVLYISAKAGVDVRIITPHIPDKKMVFAVTQSHYRALIEAGVRIYEFLPGFLHSKTVVVDDLYASVGSCNLDYRSFYLQYENGVWLCGTPTVVEMREDFLSCLSVCKEVTLEDCLHVKPGERVLRSILRIFSPLL